MKKLSLILAGVVLFGGMSFARPIVKQEVKAPIAKQAKKGTKSTKAAPATAATAAPAKANKATPAPAAKKAVKKGGAKKGASTKKAAK